MKCPNCHEGSGFVTGTRHKENSIRRRRICEKCKFRWTTVEMPVDDLKKHMITAARFIKDMQKR